MDCLRAAEILSVAHDGERMDAADLAEAHEHRASCAECLALEATLVRLNAVPAPAAPDELVERLVVLSAQAAADIRESALAARVLADSGIALTTPSDEAGARRARLLPEWWAPRFTAFAAAAVVMVVALGVGAAGIIGTLGSQRTGDDTVVFESVEAPTDGTADDSAALSSPSAEADRAAAGQIAPSYVALDSVVWHLDGTAIAAPSLVTTAGVVASSLSAADTAASTSHTAFVSNDGATLWLERDDGSYLQFSRVTRTLGLSPYVLTSDTPLVRFGVWPGLPGRFQPPASDDGSPTFAYYGFDDLGRSVYVPVAGRPTDGFAIAPGTPTDDPAAGNPNWTWWEPLR
ncbi:MAG: hypothetical protein U1E08_06110 [Coriobacteriia bacterium]|nr:hypothetical protein [Actinomycetota bacterium]MDZ4167250.1 hypothetical protein [Coriobacteriia bacterium]